MNEITDQLLKKEQRVDVSDFSGNPLSEDENRYVRMMIESDKFSRRLRTFIRVVLAWAAGGAMAVTALSDSISRFLRAMLSGGGGAH